MSGELREKCAVAAAVGKQPDFNASGVTADVLFALQHRGDEATGIASQPEDDAIAEHRDEGLVRDVFREEELAKLTGSVAVGHNRYATNGRKNCHAQPFVDPGIDFAFAHNGNLPVTDHLETFLTRNNIKVGPRNDSEMMGLAIAQFIRQGQDLASAIELAYPFFRGAFSCVAMHDGVVATFRDRKGIRPLALGEESESYIVSSETCGLDTIGASYVREVQPGEMTLVTPDGLEVVQITDGEEKLDLFEFVYFARHDSYLYGQSVNEVRRRSGENLAREHNINYRKKNNTIVVPVPDTSTPAAEGFADALGLRHRQAIIKNRFVPGRSFMQNSPEARRRIASLKHNIIPEAIKGKDVIYIDDSIVRLNTMPRLVQKAYACGARSVSVLIASPPVRFPDFYGIDTSSQDELAAANLTVEQMRSEIDCDYLGFLSLRGLIDATGISQDRLNMSCFTGEYPIGIGHWKTTIRQPVSMEGVE